MTCNFYLWPGAGPCLDGPFSVSSDLLEKDNLQYALELLAVYLIQNGCGGYYLTEYEYYKLCEDEGYNPDDHCGDDLDGYTYIDATTEGAPYPIYLMYLDYCKFEFV